MSNSGFCVPSSSHEPRAMEEFMQETGLKFRPLAADVTLNNAFFVCEGK